MIHKIIFIYNQRSKLSLGIKKKNYLILVVLDGKICLYIIKTSINSVLGMKYFIKIETKT